MTAVLAPRLLCRTVDMTGTDQINAAPARRALTPSGPAPLYRQLSDVLRDAIRRGVYGPLDRLTGPPDEVGRLLRDLNVVTGSGGAVGHSTVVLFVDGEGRIAERSTEIDLDPERVLPKIRRLLG